MTIPTLDEGPPLHEYAVEFHLPGIGALHWRLAQDLTQAFRKALGGTGTEVRWLEASVTKDTLRCVFVAPDEGAVRAAARTAHLAPDRIFELAAEVTANDRELAA
ncbi:MAG: hypothetical protein AVDCRST_MAG77-920 [uncultured Chloroflexi bacterium]|uniref:DUF4242 domain-containing protein n=1 Tax=uncultured Chloroflexota bacterium TaxID=166587 RepID=A0A6J4HS00_9CHLR|nr:MAG: hypothetical protein AVDCRST_MAG77-920 [uncultured Chloroflexota bacterium]